MPPRWGSEDVFWGAGSTKMSLRWSWRSGISHMADGNGWGRLGVGLGLMAVGRLLASLEITRRTRSKKKRARGVMPPSGRWKSNGLADYLPAISG